MTVNWNTLDYLKVLVEMVRRHSPDVPLLVVDNHSTDESARWLAEHAVRTLRLPRNVGHAKGLNVAFTLARGEYVVALDVDAFPVADDWIETVVAPLRAGAKLSGAGSDNLSYPYVSQVPYPYVHPCWLAMRRADFLHDRLVFRHRGEGHDVASDLSLLYADHLHLVPATKREGVGALFGGVVYHNFAATRPGLISTGAETWQAALDQYVTGKR